MDKNVTNGEGPVSQSAHQRVPLPAGYRQAVVTAITVLLGFSLLFLRYWNFELPGDWTISSVLAVLLLGLAIAFEFIALWRALQVKDDDELEYKKTLRWFLLASVLLFLSLLIAAVSYSDIFK